MPKNLVFREADTDAYHRGKALPVVRVGWGDDGVQVGSVINGAGEPDEGVMIGNWSRADLNTLITALRQARDDVFGAEA